ncbi:MAG: hypothetical protein AABY39_07705 [Nitrospirota bacterium]|jgi:hypothetical protein
MEKIVIKGKRFDKAKVDNVNWFSRFTLLEKIRIARKNALRFRKHRGLALKGKSDSNV